MLTLVGVGIGKDPSFDASAKTLTFSSPLDAYDVDKIKLIVSASQQKVLYHPSNDTLTIAKNAGVVTFTGSGNDTSSYADTDKMLVWVDVGSRGGMDDLSELALKTLSYSAVLDLEPKAVEQAASLEQLLDVPDSYVATMSGSGVGNYAEYAIGGPNLNADGTDIDLSGNLNIVNIRSTNDNTKVTIFKDVAGVDVLALDYPLKTDRFLDLKSEKIKIEKIDVAGEDAEVIFHVVK